MPSAEFASLLIFLGVIWLAVRGWVEFVQKRKRGLPILHHDARRPVPWGLIDLFIVFAIYMFTQIAVFGLLGGVEAMGELETLEPVKQIPVLLGFGIASLATFVLSVIAIRMRTGASNAAFGIESLKNADITKAVFVFSLVIIPVFALQWVLQLFAEEASHPLIQMLLERPSVAFFLVSSFTAVIVAPIIEEFLFRVLLQGWFENLAFLGIRPRLLLRLTGIRSLLRPAQFNSTEQMRFVFLGVPTDGAPPEFPVATPVDTDEAAESDPLPTPTESSPERGATNPYESPPASAESRHFPPPGSPDLPPPAVFDASSANPRPAWWPIIASSVLFALAHFGHGTDPIPLFFFALALGWLYQRTHRMWPCVIVHMMLNGLSMIQLLLYLQIPQP